VVGMMWSTLAQLQTWFGNEAWKSYGIQVRNSLLVRCLFLSLKATALTSDIVVDEMIFFVVKYS
jgi:hypothetical protein